MSWSTSRGRDTYGYNICRLKDRNTGTRFRTIGGGYDMQGTVLADWLSHNFGDWLATLTPYYDFENGQPTVNKSGEYGLYRHKNGEFSFDGGCGLNAVKQTAEKIGVTITEDYNRKGTLSGFFASW